MLYMKTTVRTIKNRRGCSYQTKSVLGLCVATALWLGMPSASYAEPQLTDWRAANDAVGKFLRGHIDIVRAEARTEARTGSNSPGDKQTSSGDVMTLSDVKKLALKARATDLFLLPGQSAWEQQAQAVAVTEVLLAVEQAWLAAVAANEVLRLQHNATEAAVIAEELATRMGLIGNWGADRVLAVQMDAKAQQLTLLDTQIAAKQSALALQALTMTGEMDSSAPALASLPAQLPASLPTMRGLGARADLRASADELTNDRLSRLPDYAANLAERQRWQALAGPEALAQWTQYIEQRIDVAVQNGDPSVLAIDPTEVLWNHNVKEALHANAAIAQLQASTRNTIAMAQAAVRNTHEQAMMLANEFVPLTFAAEEDAVYQYNGMFISTWNLLEQYRARVDAQIAAVNAQLLFLQTDAAYKAYMAGANYQAPVGAVGVALGAASAGGH